MRRSAIDSSAIGLGAKRALVAGANPCAWAPVRRIEIQPRSVEGVRGAPGGGLIKLCGPSAFPDRLGSEEIPARMRLRKRPALACG
jgi:hypothetical protein